MPENKPGTSQIGSSRASIFLGIEGLGQSSPYWQLCSLLPLNASLGKIWFLAHQSTAHTRISSPRWKTRTPGGESLMASTYHETLELCIWLWFFSWWKTVFQHARTKVHASCASSTSVRSRWSTFTSSHQSMTETESQWLFLLKSSVSNAWMLSAIWPVNHCVGSTVLVFGWDLQGWVMVLRNTTLRNTWFPSVTNC